MWVHRASLGAVSAQQQQIQQQIIAAANQYGVDPNLALAIAAHESGFNPNAVNRANANGTTDWGVMQLNDTTVQTLGVSNPLDPTENIDAGMRLLSQLSQKYNGDTAKILWAYNAGSGSVASGNMPSAVGNYIDWVDNYMATTSPEIVGTLAPDLASVPPDSSGSSGSSGVIDLGSVSGNNVDFTPFIAAGAAGIALLWAATR